MNIQNLINHASGQMARGDLAGAEATCRSVLQTHAGHSGASYLLAAIAMHRQQPTEARKFLEQALFVDPNVPTYHTALGGVLRGLGDHSAAVRSYRRALDLQPGNAQAKLLLAKAYLVAGEPEHALPLWQELDRATPNNAEILSYLGATLMMLRRADEAADVMERAAAITPKNVTLLMNLANAQHADGRHDDAVRTAKRVLDVDPKHAGAMRTMSVALELSGHLDEAIEQLQRSLKLEPESAQSYWQLGAVLAKTGQLDAALDAFTKASDLNPTDPFPMGNLLFHSNYSAMTHDERLELHRKWASRFTDSLQPASRDARAGHARLRIAYISPDLRTHPVAYFIRPVIENHDPTTVELFVLYDAPEKIVDERIRSVVEHWDNIHSLQDDALFALILDRKIDVLVDLTGHAGRHRLLVFARKPAPLQITYLGYCNTTGMSQMDYIVGDDITDRPGEAHPYVEKLLSVPGGFSCFSPPKNLPPVADLPAKANEFVTFGVTQALVKYTPPTLNLWSDVLKAVPTSRLLLVREALVGSTRERVLKEFESRGIDRSRIELQGNVPPSGQHLGVYDRIDISLDCQPWSGHTTSCESILMGVPFITLLGNTHAGRMAASILHFGGFDRFVAHDTKQFVEIASTLAADIPRLAALRSSLREQFMSSPSCDGPSFAKRWELVIAEALEESAVI